jgi:predicted phage terminase large subunit-like protein
MADPRDIALTLAARDMARDDLYFFSRYMFKLRRGYAWIRADHHAAICDALMRVFRGECKRLIINVPPRYSKTELAVVNFAAWAMGKAPDSEFIHTSYSGTLAANNSFQARELVQYDEYRHIFPDVEIRGDSNAKNEWRTTEGGVFYATGAMGTITGYGAGKHRPSFGGAIIIDDPHKADEAKSNVKRKNVIEWFSTTLESRKNSKDTPIILIMQRLHQDDLAGWLLGGGNGETWEHIMLPALRDDGTALWPEKHDVETLKRMEASNRFVFAGQYQQRPTAQGGNIMRGDWFQLYDVPPRMKYRVIYADTAQKTAEHNDYSVFEEWGLGEDGKIYLLDLIRGKWEIPELERRAPSFWNKAKARDAVVTGQLRQMKIEDNASGTGLIQRMKLDHRIPVAGIKRTKDKYTRLTDVIGYIESGYVCLPRNAPFLSDFVGECEAFTADDSHPHDDQIDPMIDAINDMLAGNNAAQLWERMI